MTWTYSGDPGSTTRDEVRFLVGDTDTSDQQLTDEEIAWLLSEEGSALGAAVLAAEQLAAKFARLASQSTGGISISFGERQTNYAGLASRLRRRMLGGVYAGGISIAEKTAEDEDDDRVVPFFKRGMHDHP